MSEADILTKGKVKWSDYLFWPLVILFPKSVTPNHLSTFRILLILPIILLMLLHYFKLVACFFIIAAILDGVDGSMARWRQQESKLGAILDPTADKAVNFIVFLGFVFYVKSNVYYSLILTIILIDSALFGVAIFKFFIKDIIPILDKDQKVFDLNTVKNISVKKTGANHFGKTKMVLQVIVISCLLLFDPQTSLEIRNYLELPAQLTLLHISYPLLFACIIFGILSLYGHLKVIEFKND